MPPVVVVFPSKVSRRNMDLSVLVQAMSGPTLGFGSDVGIHLSLAGGVQTKGELSKWSVTAGVSVNLPTYTVASQPTIAPSSDVHPVNFDLSQIAGILTPCFHVSWFHGCAIVEGGIVWVHKQYREGSIAYFGVGPSAGFEVPLTPWFALVVMGDFLFTSRPGISFGPGYGDTPDQDPNAQWRMPLLTGRVKGALQFTFE